MIFDMLIDRVIEYEDKQNWRGGPKITTYKNCKFRRAFGHWQVGQKVKEIDIVKKDDFIMMVVDTQGICLRLSTITTKKEAD